MNQVLIKTESHYTVDRKKVRDVVDRVLLAKGVKGKAEVSITIVGDRMMHKLNKKFRAVDATTDVLSFPLSNDEIKEVPFIDAPDDLLHLGDIVVSYPQALEEASDENKMLDDKINELIEHGLLHLLGYHHE